jgi:DeoR/GlpR family transcriptional regulator of sugar metabolism
VDAQLRRRQIADHIGNGGMVRVAALAAEFAVSEVTIRSDLSILELQGALGRVHGGAVAIAELRSSKLRRTVTMTRRAYSIVACAVECIRDDETVFLDASPMSVALARRLA